MNFQRSVHPVDQPGQPTPSQQRFVKVSDLREMLNTLFRRKHVVIATVAVALLAASIFVAFAKREYTAGLDILFENQARPMLDLRQTLGEQLRTETEVFNQMVILQSRALAKRVVDDLRLDLDPEFNPQLRPPGPLKALVARLPESWQPAARAANPEEVVIDEFLKRLGARNIPRSRAVGLWFTSTNPETAAKVLNTLADAYIEAKLDFQFESVRRGSTWLAERIQNVRQEVENAEKAVEQYRRQHNLFQTEGSMLLAQQITDLNIKLTDARIERTTAEANLTAARRLLNRTDSPGATAVQVLQSDTIRRFREQELELERKWAEMRESFGARHPTMLQLQAQREELNRKLRDEIGRILQSLDNQLKVAQMRENSLARDLEALKRQQEGANQALVGLRTLERTAEANRLMLQRMMTSFMEATAQNDLEAQVPDVRIVSPAAIPERPSSPRPFVLLPVVLLISTVAGVLLAFAVEQLDFGFRSAEQLELATGLPVLAHVPKVSDRGRDGRNLRDQPGSSFAEAIRGLYMRLVLMKGVAPQVVMVVSAQAEEGKTTLSTALARQQALAGRRTVLVDADFRRSAVARMVGLPSSPGLGEVLTGMSDLTQVLQDDPQSPAQVLLAGKQWVDSVTISSGRINAIMQELRNAFDLIIVDTAPISVISDALVLAPMTDAIVMSVRWARTPQGVIRSALNQLNQAGFHVDGLALSLVDLKQLPSHEYADYRQHAKYYAT